MGECSCTVLAGPVKGFLSLRYPGCAGFLSLSYPACAVFSVVVVPGVRRVFCRCRTRRAQGFLSLSYPTCAGFAFVAIPGVCRVFFPPLQRGGQGGWSRSNQLQVFKTHSGLVQRGATPTRCGAVRHHPPSPPLDKGGKRLPSHAPGLGTRTQRLCQRDALNR